MIWSTAGPILPGCCAGEGNCCAIHDHHRQLELIDRLVAADPALLAPTGRMTVDLTDPAGEAVATAWWMTLTGAGGDGMVVEPADALVHGVPKSRPRDPDVTAAGDLADTGDRWPGDAAPRYADEPLPAETRHTQAIPDAPGGRLVQPGVKCRGPEYLRIIYGPEYLREDKLRRLRNRGLGRKRSMALREYALGIEALDRFVAGEPLWRVYEVVFAVLALESEPVDPRL